MNLLRSSIAGLLTLAIAGPVHAGGPRYRAVSVQTEVKGPDADRIGRLQPQLEKRAGESLRLEGVQADPSSSVSVVFHVINTAEESDAGAAVSDYGTHIEVWVDGEEVGEEITLCTRKGEAELIECALSGLPKVLHLIPVEASAATAAQPVEDSADSEGSEDLPQVVAPPLGVLGIAGIVVAAGGLGLGVAGGIDLSRGMVESGAGQARSVEQVDHRPRGMGLLIGGGVALAAGAALIAVGVIRTKKKQRERRSRVQLDASPGFAGLRLTGRF